MNDFIIINRCQICDSPTRDIINLGELPLVDGLIDPKKSSPVVVVKYPAPLLFCPACTLVQLGCIVDPRLLFPKEYPYTSGSTSVLRKNFQDLALEALELLPLSKDDLIIDIGCNDGTLLNNFKNQTRVLGITPEDMGTLARDKGIDVKQSYFTPELTRDIFAQYGHAKIITATNVLAHFKDVHEAVRCIKELLHPNGLFVSESGYFYSMLRDLQYDSIHHEHLRYYTLTSLNYLFKEHGLEIIHAKEIPTHGGSIRVYAAREGSFSVKNSVQDLLQTEKNNPLNDAILDHFRSRIIKNKFSLYRLLADIKLAQKTITGISAPGRATTLMNYVGIDKKFIEKTVETEGSRKIGMIIPGTEILITPESQLYQDQPDYALLFSWHIADELMKIIKFKGFKGDFILPLPETRIISNSQIPSL